MEITKDTYLYIAPKEGDGDDAKRWQTVSEETRVLYAPAFLFKGEEDTTQLFHRCAWLLSFYEPSTIGDVERLLYDGDFLDEVLECVPEGKRKTDAVYKVTAATDKTVAHIKELIDEA